MNTLKISFSDPRKVAEFDNWPSGAHRVKCRFETETGKRGTRVLRTTTDKNGLWCKPKATVWSGPSAIVTGSDGHTYILLLPLHCGLVEMKGYGAISILRHDFMDATGEAGAGSVFESSDPVTYALLHALIVAAR